MNPNTFDSAAKFALLVREHVRISPQVGEAHGLGHVARVGRMRMWICPGCAARITARGFGFFAGWVAPYGGDLGRQCIGGCGDFLTVTLMARRFA